MKKKLSISHGIFIIIFPSGPIQGGLGISPIINKFKYKLFKLGCKTMFCIPIKLDNILFSSLVLIELPSKDSIAVIKFTSGAGKFNNAKYYFAT
jgi:hypothetical protein